jgi:hypothetical protein
MIRIQLSQKTRSEMNTSTPRDGDWTYHHVLPVRYYFTIAYLCAYMVVNKAADSAISKDARACLKAMANNGANRGKIDTLSGAGKSESEKAKAVLDHAKMCASPLFGGFAGMNPEQRCDDPKEGPEPNRPESADVGWWAALQLLKEHVEMVFPTIGGTGEKNLDVEMDETAFEWFVASLKRHIIPLSAWVISPFDASDWKYCPSENPRGGGPWIFAQRGAGLAAWAPARQFDGLNKNKSAKNVGEFNKLWGGGGATEGLKYLLAGSFALTDRPLLGGKAENVGPDLLVKAKAKPAKVFRQINDRLVLYIPD